MEPFMPMVSFKRYAIGGLDYLKNIRRYFKRHPRIGFTIDFVTTAICLMIAYLLLPGMLGTLIAVAGLLLIRSLLGTYWSDQGE
ncbi:hypothetical protein N1I81_15230 [Bacillus sp. FSL M8-0052]|uniref:hypothetical protein n=1 Tax=Bacillus sp. FSL M8-0052 TaxID=2978203 RepID=UPI0030F7301E